jgi:hypothetical protein
MSVVIKDAAGALILFTFDGYDLDLDPEFGGSELYVRYTTTLGGGLHVASREQIAGRPLVVSGDAWLTRTELAALHDLANAVEAAYVLEINGRAFSVVFDHENGPPLVARPLVPRPNHDDADLYSLTLLRFKRM